MKTTYGSIVSDKGEGLLRPFKITHLMGIDEETGDGRIFEGAGGGVRSLPRTVFGGFSEGGAHDDNVVIGRLDAVELDPENNTSTGWGWLLDDDNGRQAAIYASTKALRHNSVHLAEIEMEIRWGSDDPSDPAFFEYTLVFSKWKIASTTMLAIPAFAESSMELTAAMRDEIYADDSLLEIDNAPDGEHTFDIVFPEPTRELVASLDPKPRPPWEWFYRAEDALPTPITLGEPNEHGFIPVFGNLARWNTCHDGFLERCVVAPYDPSEYSTFNAFSVLTTRGSVSTGPIFFKGGHPDKPLGDRDVAQAYGGIENAWADVRVSHGQHGPWVCGYVREGTDDKAIIAARASGISGHWAPDYRLKAIASVNVPGFDVPRAKVFTDEDGNVLELVASFVPDCGPSEPKTQDWTADFVTAAYATFAALREAHPLSAAPPAYSRLRVHDDDGNTHVLEFIPRKDPADDDVDVSDPAAVARHLALLDLEAEEDADLGLV